jgi:hypothetical protein
VPDLIASLGNKKKPEEKVCALQMLSKLAATHPQQIAWCLVDALPPALELLVDIKKRSPGCSFGRVQQARKHLRK